MNHKHHFIEDGCDRAQAAISETIRNEVDQEFREQLAAANWLQRLSLRHTMRREVRQRINRQAPVDALY